eukprot:5763047-Pyramimonas_sp.AAC.1
MTDGPLQPPPLSPLPPPESTKPGLDVRKRFSLESGLKILGGPSTDATSQDTFEARPAVATRSLPRATKTYMTRMRPTPPLPPPPPLTSRSLDVLAKIPGALGEWKGGGRREGGGGGGRQVRRGLPGCLRRNSLDHRRPGRIGTQTCEDV